MALIKLLLSREKSYYKMILILRLNIQAILRKVTRRLDLFSTNETNNYLQHLVVFLD